MRRPEACLDVLEEALGLLRRDQTELGELPRVERADARMLVDQLVHERLGVARLVALVVTEAPVADEVDDDVVVEPLPKAHRQPDRRDRRLWIVRVHVDDRRVEALRQVGGVARRTTLVGVGREADLIVGDHVQRAPGGVAGQAAEVEGLGDDPLAGESSIAVDEDGEREVRVVAALG